MTKKAQQVAMYFCRANASAMAIIGTYMAILGTYMAASMVMATNMATAVQVSMVVMRLVLCRCASALRALIFAARWLISTGGRPILWLVHCCFFALDVFFFF